MAGHRRGVIADFPVPGRVRRSIAALPFARRNVEQPRLDELRTNPGQAIGKLMDHL